MDVDSFPTDPKELIEIIAQQNAVIVERDEQIAQRDAVIAQRDAVIAERERHIIEMQARHKAQMDAILRRLYGPRSESFDPTQLLLFGLAVVEQIPVDEKVVEAESGQKLTTRRINHHKHGRQKLPDHLPRFEVPHDLTEEQRKCPCCGIERARIGSEVSEQLEFVPASFKVLKHIRFKYACNACSKNCTKCDCKAHIEIAAKPAQPIEKGLPGSGLLAHIIVSKLGDHLPLYRLERIFERSDISIARSTMCAWMMSCSQLVEPLVKLMRQRVKQSKVIHTDDTTVKVQDANLKGRCRTGRVWCYLGDESNPYDVFDFSPDRKREHPQKFLHDFKGHLQADAYGGYDGIYTRGEVIEVACWAHARRKFFEAKETDGKRAGEMLRMIGRLYRIERAIKLRIERRKNVGNQSKNDRMISIDDSHEFIRSIRQRRSTRLLDQIKSWLDREKAIVLPRSPMGQAIQYALNQWEALCRFTEQGYLNIDNNAAERALKRVAIGRKNWLFAGHDKAGSSHATFYTLIASAERHGLDPHKYLMSVLAKIGQTKLSELDQFLPEVWKAEDACEPVQSSVTPSPSAAHP